MRHSPLPLVSTVSSAAGTGSKNPALQPDCPRETAEMLRMHFPSNWHMDTLQGAHRSQVYTNTLVTSL